jgi:2-amino-4-hydroxy-6-hydroxymethyldihydropteridine diphosphokinase
MAWLSLGSNAGAPLRQIEEAERLLAALPRLTVNVRSKISTAPADRPKQQDFCYRILGVETEIKARALLDHCIGIEAAMGRDHRDVWGPRLIDIDIVAYDDIEIRSSRLHLPHAFAHSRPYIFEPLREIAPDVAAFVMKVGTKPR